jgi:zinc and cadmium transporter
MSMIAVLGLACAGSVGAMAGALAVAASPAGWRSRLQPLLLAYSAGTLLAAALLGMLPRAFAALPGPQAGLTVLAGFLLLYAIERASVWHHCHDGSCAARRGRGRLILIGDAFHNFVDGIVIAAAFHTSLRSALPPPSPSSPTRFPRRWDYAILLSSGLSRRQALGWNLLSALATLPGALLGYFMLSDMQGLVPHALAISAASFLYIALGDLLPRLHEQADRGQRGQLPMLILGIATILVIRLNH